MNERVSRRRLLAGLGTVGAAALAGCSTASGASASRLAYVRVANWHEQSHTVHVLVERDGQLVGWSSHDLPERKENIETRTLNHSWATTEGEFVVRVRLDNEGTWKVFDLSGREGDCYGVEARVNQDGSLGIWYEKAPAQCQQTAQQQQQQQQQQQG